MLGPTQLRLACSPAMPMEKPDGREAHIDAAFAEWGAAGLELVGYTTWGPLADRAAGEIYVFKRPLD